MDRQSSPSPLVSCLFLTALVAAGTSSRASASPWMWDQDGNGLDDRIEEVASSGILSAFENMDPTGRLRFSVELVDNALQYGAYVRFVSAPTAQDSLDLTLQGSEVVTRFESVPYIRVRCLYPSLVLIAGLPRVERVEAMSLMYPLGWEAGRSMGVRSGSGIPFPTLPDLGDPIGEGAVIAVLDTGINDTPIAAYPGHQDLTGKIVGGAFYGTQGPIGYTSWTQSENPSQVSLGVNGHHGTSMAGLIAGGSRDRVLGGIAPGARLVDVKVLDDEGIGYGLAEGLEWCIQNRNRVWGPEDAGIDVVNLSLSGLDASDGSDCVCELVNTAVDLGIAVVAAVGNTGDCGTLSSPAAADNAIAVGSFNAGVPGDSGDDLLAPFTTEGPRPDDGDLETLDEMKPDVVAPGVSVACAWGSPLSDGFGYKTVSGTSVSAALVTGLVAVLRAQDPSLTPSGIRTLLHDTALHRLDGGTPCSAADPFGVDPRYHTGWGFGTVDAVAAWEELVGTDRTQFVSLAAVWNSGAGTVDLRWTTQRESGLSGFRVERAPDAGGAPGAFGNTGPLVPAVGYSDLTTGNRTQYQYSETPPFTGRWWYRVTTTGASPHASVPVSVHSESESGRMDLSLTHNVAETDLVLTLGVGSLVSPDWIDMPSVLGDLDSVGTASLAAGSSQVPLFLSRELWSDSAPYLPPGPGGTWWLRAEEGGDPARSGSLTGFSISILETNYQTGTPTPLPTMEGQSSILWIPAASTGIPDRAPRLQRLRVHPNPILTSASIEIGLDPSRVMRLSIIDVVGGLVRDLTPSSTNAHRAEAVWDGRDQLGRRVPAGRYFVVLNSREGRTVLPVLYLSR